jgi:hypothetical protein
MLGARLKVLATGKIPVRLYYLRENLRTPSQELV